MALSFVSHNYLKQLLHCTLLSSYIMAKIANIMLTILNPRMLAAEPEAGAWVGLATGLAATGDGVAP